MKNPKSKSFIEALEKHVKPKQSPNKQKEKMLLLDAFDFKNTDFKAEAVDFGRNFQLWDTAKSVFLIFIGSLLTSFSFYFFINAADLYTNGLSAVSQLITKLLFWKYENTDPAYFDQMRALYFYPIFFAINIPIIIWGFFKVGVRFTIYTTIYMGFNIAILSLLALTPYLKDFKVFSVTITDDNRLAVSFIFASIAGIIYGTGLGLLFKVGGSSGGMDFISTYISMRRKYSISTIIRNTNIIIVLVAVLIDGMVTEGKDPIQIYFSDPGFFATIIYIYIGSFVMSRVYPKYTMMTVFIISQDPEKVRESIYENKYSRGGNTWKVQGMYSGKEYDMIMTTMSLLEYNFLRNKIFAVDEKAVMIAISTRIMQKQGY